MRILRASHSLSSWARWASRIPFVSVLLLAGAAQAQEAPPTPLEALAAGRAAVVEASYAEALPSLTEARAALTEGTPAWREARFYELLARLLLPPEDGQGADPAEEADTEESRRLELGTIARAIRTHRGEADPTWRTLFELAALRLEPVEGRWRPLEELLGYWGRSTDLEMARQEYLRLVWAYAREGRDLWRLRGESSRRGLAWLQQAATIAQTPENVARFNLLYARGLQYMGDLDRPEQTVRRGQFLERAVAAGAQTPDHGRALLEYANWAATAGRQRYDGTGRLVLSPDYEKALAAYAELLATEKMEWAPLRREAKRARENIMEPRLTVLVSHAFRPDTEVQFAVQWRNVEAPRVTVHRIQMPELPWDPSREDRPESLHAANAIYGRSLEAAPPAPHFGVSELVRMGDSLLPGAYYVEATSGEQRAAALLYVTDLVVVAHHADEQSLFYVCHATTGRPVRDAEIRLIARSAYEERADQPILEVSGRTGEDGVWAFTWPAAYGSRLAGSVFATSDDRGCAALPIYLYPRRYERHTEWDLYTMTDRSLFRPGETAEVKGWLRLRAESGWEVPTTLGPLAYRVRGPRGDLLHEGEIELNAYGSFALAAEIPAEAALGNYSLQLEVPNGGQRNRTLYGTLFRVEAFRTPEIEAAIALGAPPAAGAWQPGDTLEGTVQVDYYAGGAVEDATVELVVNRRPYRRDGWARGSVDGWRIAPPRPFHTPSTEVARFDLVTDARGTASFVVPTSPDGEEDWTYTLEARVRDLSRRETVTRAEVHLTRQSYFAELSLEQQLIAPGDRAELTVRLSDANDDPVEARGTVRISQERWREVYVHRRRGNEISGVEYRSLPDRSMLSAAQSDYRLREAGFVTEEVLVEELVTGADGTAGFAYAPTEVGYYRFNWLSRAQRGLPVKAEVPLWVSDEATTEIGFRPGGVQLIADEGPHAVGAPITVMLATPAQDREVFLTYSARSLRRHEVVRVSGTSRLLRITPEPADQPNFFIDASMVSDEAHFVDRLELSVPPVRQFLETSLELDRTGYRPGETAEVTVRVRDAEGNPVATEVALAVSDEALYSLQPSDREPVREAFYSQRNSAVVTVDSSLRATPFFQPLEGMEEDVEVADALSFPEEEIIELNAFSVAGAEGLMSLRSAPMRADMPPPPAEMAAAGRDAMEGFTLRSNFQSTILWAPFVQTDAQGTATVPVTFPDNLTAWRFEAVAITAETRVGEARAETTTRLPLIARLQTPRFLTERDASFLTGVFQNNTGGEISIRPTLSAEGGIAWTAPAEDVLTIPAGGLGRMDWVAEATTPGPVAVRLRADLETVGDAVERSFEVVPHGTRRVTGLLGWTEAGSIRLPVEIPPVNEAHPPIVTVKAAGSLAPELFGALPYLIEYPYGCTEQTLSRFVPALAVRRVTGSLGFDLEAVDASVYRSLSPGAVEGREDLRAVLDAVLAESVDRLATMQLRDGSWPWLPQGQSDAYMTAYAVWALTYAEELELDLGSIRLAAARALLERYLTEQDLAVSAESWILLALASRHRADGFGRPTRLEARAFLDLMNRREELAPMAKAMLVLAARYFGFEEDAQVLLRNLRNSVQIDNQALPGATDASGQPLSLPTVHWGRSAGYFDWSEGAVESTAMILKALLLVDPEHEWVDGAVSWLARNRTGTHWGNTRATAFVLLAMTDYLRLRGQGFAGAEFTFEWEGAPVALERPSAPWEPTSRTLPVAELREGQFEVTVRRTDGGTGGFFFAVHTDVYDEREGLAAASSDLGIRRRYQHLKPVPTLLEGIREVMTPLTDGDPVSSGDRIEVVLELEVPRDLRYVLVEDLKPAGFEAVQLLSGPGARARAIEGVEAGTGKILYGPRELTGYQELRDRQVAFLFDRLPAGRWELRYRLRAESPGTFHALPATAEPMYLPHVRGSSAETRLEVRDE